jgi:hypothetical protein
MHLISAWSDYFTGSPTIIQTQTAQTPSGTSVHVLNSLFRSITSSDRGAALLCTSVTYLLIESSSFFSCRTSYNYGGTICFYNSGGQCVLHEVCGYDCCSTYTGGNAHDQFSYTKVKNDASSKNYVNYSSIIRCVNDNSNSYHTMRHYYGKQYYQSFNLSMNKCYGRVTYYYPYSDSNYATCSLLYSTFADNIASGHTFITLETSGAKYEIKYCNILRNTQANLGSCGTFYIYAYLNVEDSCILENKANYIFYHAFSSYTTTISRCTVDKTASTGNVIFQNTVTKSFILALNHMSTRNCYSEYDSVGTLTPITQPSSLKKQKLYCSCEKFFLQLRLRDVVSLISILIFNYNQLYTSGDL